MFCASGIETEESLAMRCPQSAGELLLLRAQLPHSLAACDVGGHLQPAVQLPHSEFNDLKIHLNSKYPLKLAHKINWLVIRKKRIEGDTVCYTPLWEVNLNIYGHKEPEKFCDEDIFFYVCNLGCGKFICS